MSDYLVGLESSGWLRHIKSVVDAANFLTKVHVFPLLRLLKCILRTLKTCVQSRY